MNIDIYVNEGKKYYFRNIYFNGNTRYDDSLLTKIINIKRGEVYNQKLLDERIFMNPNGGDLSSLYMDDGYLFFSVTPMEVKIEGDTSLAVMDLRSSLTIDVQAVSVSPSGYMSSNAASMASSSLSASTSTSMVAQHE